MELDPETYGQAQAVSEQIEGLQQALLRLTSQPVDKLEEEIRQLNQRLDELMLKLESLEGHLNDTTGELNREDSDLRTVLVSAQQSLGELNTVLVNPENISERMRPVFVDVVRDQVQAEQEKFADAIFPVMGLAIRKQIRNAREEIVEALYPIIGQIMAKSIAEAMREIIRNIDRSARQGLDFGSRWNQFVARLRGVSKSELIFRGSTDYQMQHAFLIHRNSGLLIERLSSTDSDGEDFDLISGMLTAISDFVRDSFGRGEGELEEIAHGDQRILLASGRLAYVAVVLDGIEPTGYAAFMDHITTEINLEHEDDLKAYRGQADPSVDFVSDLARLLDPKLDDWQSEAQPALSAGQKRALLIAILSAAILLVGTIFACIFAIRLWPLAF
jgi:hypothetical protein